jgi:hypothetical protein
MEDQINSVEALFEKTTDYLETKIELAKLQAVNKITDVVSSLVSRLIIMIIIILMVVVLNTGIALWLGEMMGKMYYGFFCVAGLYLLLALVLAACRHNWLKKPIGNRLVRKMLN